MGLASFFRRIKNRLQTDATSDKIIKMNRIKKLQEDNKILYFSAGYPNLNDTVQIIQDLEKTASI
jgi:tryptophan synthase alpha subunit